MSWPPSRIELEPFCVDKKSSLSSPGVSKAKRCSSPPACATRAGSLSFPAKLNRTSRPESNAALRVSITAFQKTSSGVTIRPLARRAEPVTSTPVNIAINAITISTSSTVNAPRRREREPANPSVNARPKAGTLPITDNGFLVFLARRPERKNVVAVFVVRAWIAILIRAFPRIFRDFVFLEIRPAPAIRFVGRRGDQRLQSFGCRRIIAHVHAVLLQRDLDAALHKNAGQIGFRIA